MDTLENRHIKTLLVGGVASGYNTIQINKTLEILKRTVIVIRKSTEMDHRYHYIFNGINEKGEAVFVFTDVAYELIYDPNLRRMLSYEEREILERKT